MEQDPDAPELDLSSYPERVACKAMPSLNGESAEVELTDVDDEPVMAEVPLGALRLLGMPQLPKDLPAEVKEPFEKGVGLAMLSCRIDDKQANKTIITVPTVTGSMTLEVTPKAIVRKVKDPAQKEAEESETLNKIIRVLEELKTEWGLEVEEGDLERLQEMAPDGRIGYLFDALEEAGVVDPVEVLKEKGILE